jgi:cysteinyl-tRNA synthetase
MLQVEGKKMSKSLGNFFTVRDLLDQGVPGEVIRFVMLSTHYRKPMDWTAEKAREAEEKLRKWRGLLTGVGPTKANLPLVHELSSDLNTSKALTLLGLLADDLKQHQYWEKHGVKELIRSAADLEGEFLASAHLLGLLLPETGEWYDALAEIDLSKFAAHLSEVRAEAMASKDFTEVDRLKAAYTAAGLEVRMSKAGVDLVPGAGFDPSKLEGLV